MPSSLLPPRFLVALACAAASGCSRDTVAARDLPATQTVRVVVDSSLVVAQGEFSQATSASSTVLTSDSAFTTWWAALGTGTPMPSGGSFQDSVLVGVTQGPYSTSGYGIWVDSVTGDRAHPVVHVRERSSVGCPVLTVETSPYQVVRVPALGDSVSFAVTRTVRSCP